MNRLTKMKTGETPSNTELNNGVNTLKELEQKLKPFSFATIINDKKMKGSGLKRGEEVFIMSTKDVAYTKTDPYLKRTLMIVAKLIGNTVMVPSPNNDYHAFVVDPRNLEPVSDERNKELVEHIRETSD